MATRKGLEPSTSSVTGWHSKPTELPGRIVGGNNRARTCDPLLVRQMLSQLSYAPPLPTDAAEPGFPQAALLYYLIHFCLSSYFFTPGNTIFIYYFVILMKWYTTTSCGILSAVGL